MKKRIAILGATGTVGQKAIKLLEDHPNFEVTELVASDRSTGKIYGEIVDWRESSEIPSYVKNIKLIDHGEVTADYALSALPSDVAKSTEIKLAEKGVHVISNASAYRMDPNVPLLIPEINPGHLKLVDKQKTKGKIITNPNCATVFLALGLFPLMSLGHINHVSVITLQGLSGAGFPGVASLDIVGNTIPNISGEEEKVETESAKILGAIDCPADFQITAHVNRVPVISGHTVGMHVFFDQDVSAAQVKQAFEAKRTEFPELYRLYDNPFRPQPAKDISWNDQRAHIGRIKQGGSPNVVGLVSMGHNLVRGAAGAAILNLELFDRYLENSR